MQDAGLPALALAAAAVALLVFVAPILREHARMRASARTLRLQAEAIQWERERIARELHDTLLQSVQGMLLNIDAVIGALHPTDPVRIGLQRALAQAEHGLVETRDTIQGIRTRRACEPFDLLRCRGAALSLRTGTRFRLEETGMRRALAPAVAEHLAFIAIEAMENAFRHAGATAVTVRVVHGAAGLTLSVEDDGRGLDARACGAGLHPGRFGIVGMQERAREIGASLALRPTGKAGTAWLLDLPVPAPSLPEPVPDAQAAAPDAAQRSTLGDAAFHLQGL